MALIQVLRSPLALLLVLACLTAFTILLSLHLPTALPAIGFPSKSRLQLPQATSLTAAAAVPPSPTPSVAPTPTPRPALSRHLRSRLSLSPLTPTNLTSQLVVLAMFKNEALGLEEWLQHYLWQGAGHILLLDNNSTDAWQAVVARFPPSLVTVLPAPQQHSQVRFYNTLALPWLRARGATHVAVCDLDEYFWGAQGQSFAQLSLGALAGGAGGFTCPFHHFNSNGYDAHPPSLRKCLTRRSDVTSAVEHGKSVVSLPSLRVFNIHVHASTAPPAPCPPGLLLFHYKTQSRQYWREVKSVRGSATTAEWDTVRDWAFFDADEAVGNKTTDTRLRDSLPNSSHIVC